MSSSDYSPEYLAEDSSGDSFVQITVMPALATVFVALRIGVHLWRKVGFHLDDWLVLVSIAFAWGMYVVFALGYQKVPVGRHVVVLTREESATMQEYFFITYHLYATVLATTKWSILAMYYRIFPTRFMKWSTLVISVVVAMWWIACILVSVFGCHPIRKNWDLFAEGWCIDNVKVFIGKAVPNFTTDLIMLFLPINEVRKLHMKTTQKIALSTVFLTGGVGCAASVARFAQIREMSRDNTDPSWILPDNLLWTTVEPCVGIIAACLPPLRPLLTVLLKRAGLGRLWPNREEKKPNVPPEIVTIGGSGGKRTLIREGSRSDLLHEYDSRTVVEGPSLAGSGTLAA
ncbi:hypothetical protein BJX68DRAFT_271841 [Aspergillus pseudodeflectus]|uniref:Rhodopsin domain-containing protein n=1 Tax=Aspergillus pseudodeflectus TaxID=176178 RepID=A0ABR4JJD8_9EURO